MLLQITNTCLMACKHCFQDSNPTPQHMSDEIFEKALAFIRTSEAKQVLVTGGEPTMHPKWDTYVDRIAEAVDNVIILSNGSWIGDPAEEERVTRLFKKYRNVTMRVTSVAGIYPKHNETVVNVRVFAVKLARKNMPHRLFLDTTLEHIQELGRACKDPCMQGLAQADEATTCSCFTSILTAMQLRSIKMFLKVSEMREKLCHPLLDWQGNLHWSESWLCPSFASVNEAFEDIEKKAVAWRPCGACAGFKKLLAKKDIKYTTAKSMLNIHPPREAK